MTSLQELFHIIEQLPPEYQEQLYDTAVTLNSYWQRRQQYLALSHSQQMITLEKALDNFRMGLSDTELNQMLDEMSQSRQKVEKPDPFAWLADLPEDER